MTILKKFLTGFKINLFCGMGGSVGLKCTDGREILLKVINLGAKPSSFQRVKELLNELREMEILKL